MKTGWWIGALALLLAGCTDFSMTTGDPRPNVVLVTIDTLRPDHLAPYGYEKNTAPFIEEIAENAATFLRAYGTSSWTAPTSASIFTGLYPTRHGVIESLHAARIRRNSQKKNALLLTRIGDDVKTLPERLQAAGYTTFGVGANPNIGPEIGFSRGFDHFKRLDFGFTEVGKAVVHDYAHADVAAKALLDWEDEIKEASPSFIYLHLNDPHVPYNEREPWFEAPKRIDPKLREEAAYDSEIAYLDSVLAQLYERLDWDDNTLFILVSDHGEAWGEHGYYRHPLKLHRELTRVLMMVSGPDLGIDRQLVLDRVSQVDLVPTILQLLDEPPPEDLDGESLAPLILGGDETEATRRSLDELVPVANTTGVRMLLENLPYACHYPFLVMGELRPLVDAYPEAAVGLVVDTGHAWTSGNDPAAEIRTAGSRLWGTHLQDVDAVDEANGRVIVMINIFGRSTPVELEHWQIESV